jgi:ribosomal protein S18 acetylase RimI-like enzyme
MVRIKQIKKSELPELVKISYANDVELFNKYHVGKLDFNNSVLITLDMIDKTSRLTPINYYKVVYNKQAIGYVVSFRGFLYSFAINKNFRTKEILQDYWNGICKILGEHFICWLYPNNTRAINWLQKCGMKIVEINKELNRVTLLHGNINQ